MKIHESKKVISTREGNETCTQNFVGNILGKIPLGRPGSRSEFNIKFKRE
jgi:hypothetical protein